MDFNLPGWLNLLPGLAGFFRTPPKTERVTGALRDSGYSIARGAYGGGGGVVNEPDDSPGPRPPYMPADVPRGSDMWYSVIEDNGDDWRDYETAEESMNREIGSQLVRDALRRRAEQRLEEHEANVPPKKPPYQLDLTEELLDLVVPGPPTLNDYQWKPRPYTRGGGPRRGRARTRTNTRDWRRLLSPISTAGAEDLGKPAPKRAPPRRRGPQRRTRPVRRTPPRRGPSKPAAPPRRLPPLRIPKSLPGINPLNFVIKELLYPEELRDPRPKTPDGGYRRGRPNRPYTPPTFPTPQFPAPGDIRVDPLPPPAPRPLPPEKPAPAPARAPARTPRSAPAPRTAPSRLLALAPSLLTAAVPLLFGQPATGASTPRLQNLTPSNRPQAPSPQQPFQLGQITVAETTSDPCAVRARDARRRQRRRRKQCRKFTYKRIKVCQSSRAKSR